MAKEKTEAHEAPRCPFNIGVALEGCEIDQCRTCGWNPDEEKRRKETLRRMEETRHKEMLRLMEEKRRKEMLRLMEEAGKLVNGKPLRV